MRIEDLIIFTDVVRYHSMNIASEKHFMSPQNLSKIIRNMENELGVLLFKRSKKGSELTEEGERFYLQVQKVLKEYAHAIEGLHQNENWNEEAELESETVKVLCNQGVTNFAVLNAYKLLQKETKYNIYLDLELMENFDPKKSLKSFERNTYDIIVCALQEQDIDNFLKHCEEYILIYVIQDEFVLLVSKEHPLAACSMISIDEIPDLKLLLPKENYIYSSFWNLGIKCQMVANSLNLIIEQVEHSDEFCTLVCKSLIKLNSELKSNDLLVSVPIDKKVYGVYVILLHENVSEKVFMREFVRHIVQNISGANSY